MVLRDNVVKYFENTSGIEKSVRIAHNYVLWVEEVVPFHNFQDITNLCSWGKSYSAPENLQGKEFGKNSNLIIYTKINYRWI